MDISNDQSAAPAARDDAHLTRGYQIDRLNWFEAAALIMEGRYYLAVRSQYLQRGGDWPAFLASRHVTEAWANALMDLWSSRAPVGEVARLGWTRSVKAASDGLKLWHRSALDASEALVRPGDTPFELGRRTREGGVRITHYTEGFPYSDDDRAEFLILLRVRTGCSDLKCAGLEQAWNWDCEEDRLLYRGMQWLHANFGTKHDARPHCEQGVCA
jgi:hypothetical protein